jgi:hypothetical protein
MDKDLMYNYCALALAILTDCTADKALGYFGLNEPDVVTDGRRDKKSKNWNPERDAELIRLREDEELSYMELAEIFGLSPWTCRHRYMLLCEKRGVEYELRKGKYVR